MTAEIFTSILTGYGLPGLGVLAAGWLYLAERKAHQLTRDKLDAEKDKRLEDKDRGWEALTGNTAVISSFTQVLQDRRAGNQ